MRAAAVQLTATSDRDRNLEVADDLVSRSVTDGARLVVLPELFNLLGRRDVMRAGAESLDGPSSTWAAGRARAEGIWLVAGSITERIADDERAYNTSCLYDPEGHRVATYRKIHLFDNDVPGAAYRESATVRAGEDLVTAAVTAGDDSFVYGFSTCYDLRFPELFRILALRGASVIGLPSAFTHATGSVHWEPLVRARAIENQTFLVAPNQAGETEVGIRMWGHTLVVDPWGTILAATGADAGDTVVVADLDLTRIDEVRARLPALFGRRPDRYRWPDDEPGGPPPDTP